MTGRVSAAGVELIKRSEGVRLQAYLCAAGHWTIGYGHTKGVLKGDVITREDAEDLLLEDLAVFERCVREATAGTPLTQPQFDALVSFAFNVGCQALQKSTLLARLKAGDLLGAAAEFDRWTRAAGAVAPGLVARRAEERAMFERGIIGEHPHGA